VNILIFSATTKVSTDTKNRETYDIYGISQYEILRLSDLKMKNRVTLSKYQSIGLKSKLVKKFDSSNRL